jgi:hypothetical protein
MNYFSSIWTPVVWILGIVITNSIATSWRRKGWLFEQRMTYYKERYFRRNSVIQSAFNLVDKRIVASRNYSNTLSQNDPNALPEERKTYRSIVNEWGSSIHLLIIDMKTTFDDETGREFDRFFPKRFHNVDEYLRSARIAVENSDAEYTKFIRYAEEEIKHINATARAMSYKLQEKADIDKNYIDATPHISIENIEVLSYAYLLKSLFQPSTKH